MAEKGTTPNPAGGARRGKRRAPTIDLTATDVSPRSAASGPEASVTEPSPNEHVFHPDADSPGPPHNGDDKRQDWMPPRQLILAGLAGGGIVAAALGGIWFAGLVPGRDAESASADSTVIVALSNRVARIEAAVAKLPASDKSIPDRLAAAENAMKSLGIALSALGRRSDEAASAATDARARADAADKAVTELRDSVQNLTRSTSAGLSQSDVDTVQKKLSALEEAIKTPPVDRPARLAVVAASLREAVFRGAAFSAEFNEAKSLGADERLLTPLASFAANGVPGATAMAHELSMLIPVMMKASGVQLSSGGFLERLESNAEKLVRIRPVNAPAGDGAAAELPHIETDVAHADIDGALADLGKLDDKTRAPALDWIDRARARQAALTAADQLAATSAHALGKR